MRALVAGVVLLAVSSVYAQEKPEGWVNDSGHMFTGEGVAKIRSTIATFREQQGVQLAVLTLEDTRGADPKIICIQELNTWNPGPRSVILFASTRPRKLYLQPGTDLQGIFTEAVSSEICRGMASDMKAGRSEDAFLGGIAAIQVKLNPAEAATQAPSEYTIGSFWLPLAAVSTAVSFVIFLVLRSGPPVTSPASQGSLAQTMARYDAPKKTKPATSYGAPAPSSESSYSSPSESYSAPSYDYGSSSSSYDSGSSSSFSDCGGGSCDGGGGGGGDY